VRRLIPPLKLLLQPAIVYSRRSLSQLNILSYANASQCIILHHFFDFFLSFDRLTGLECSRDRGAKAGGWSRHPGCCASSSRSPYRRPCQPIQIRNTIKMRTIP